MGSQKQERFMDKVVFRKFKHFLNIIARMTEKIPVKYMQDRCIQYLLDNNEPRAHKWFVNTWTGERGTWTGSHAGPGCANTNNAVESGWGRFRSVIPRHYSYPEYMSTMLKHISDNTKDTHDALIQEYDSIEFPDAPRLSREIWKNTLSIDFDELDKWVVYEGDDKPWVDTLKLLEEYQKSHSIDSLARAAIMWSAEKRAPLLDGIRVIHVFHPTQEMRELFGDTFSPDSAQYHKCVGMSYF